MSEVLEWMDEWGPEKVIVVHDTKTGMKGMLVIDNTARGMGKGGCRMQADVTLWDCFRLARTMTWKWAIAGISLGGAKSAIVNDPNSPNKEEIIRAFVKAIRKYLPNEYVFGNDMGFCEKDEEIVIDECGGDIRVAVGTPAELGGLPYDELGLTGYGVAVATEIAAEHRNMSLENTKIAIQGLGAVGSFAAKFLYDKGAKIVAVSSVNGALYQPQGLDIERIWQLKTEYGDNAIEKYEGAVSMPIGEELEVDTDILIPAAKGDVITHRNAADIKAKLIIEGANFPVTPDAQDILNQKGTLIIPDFVANAGAAISTAFAMEQRFAYTALDHGKAYSTICDKMMRNVSLVLNEAERQDKSPRQIALDIAKERVLNAMKLKGRIS